jgi:hypothetical protein
MSLEVNHFELASLRFSQRWRCKSRTSCLGLRAVLRRDTNVSEDLDTYIFRGSPKRWYPTTTPKGVTTQKTSTCITNSFLSTLSTWPPFEPALNSAPVLGQPGKLQQGYFIHQQKWTVQDRRESCTLVENTHVPSKHPAILHTSITFSFIADINLLL